MRDYGKVYSTFWSSKTTGALSDQGKVLALYLMTCAHSTIAGVFRMPEGYVSEDLGWTSETVKQGFKELFDKGFAKRCEASKWVWVIKHLEWNKAENPNQSKSIAKIANSVPSDCCWRVEFVNKYKDLPGVEPVINANPSSTLGQGFANQDQEQKQEQEQEQKAGTGVSAAAEAAPSKRGTRIADDWQLPKAWGEWALAEYPHWTADVVRKVATKFHNFWKAKTGKDATKLDWPATWQNWCMSGITQDEHPAPRNDGAIAAAAVANESAAKAARILAARQAAGGAVVPAADLLGANHA